MLLRITVRPQRMGQDIPHIEIPAFSNGYYLAEEDAIGFQNHKITSLPSCFNTTFFAHRLLNVLGFNLLILSWNFSSFVSIRFLLNSIKESSPFSLAYRRFSLTSDLDGATLPVERQTSS